MSQYAVIDSGVVVNVIVADSLAIAEEVTGHQCVDFEPHIRIGNFWSSEFNTYIYPKPLGFNSWVYDPSTHEWKPPVPAPTDDLSKSYTWVEVLQTWIEIPGETVFTINGRKATLDEYHSYLRWNPETEIYDEMDEPQEPGPFSWPNTGV
jgi:hypothetical protein